MITFDEKKDIKPECFGTMSESVSPCQVQYKPKKCQQAQIMAQPTKNIAGFEMDAEVQLKTGQHYDLIDICVTDDNKLLLTNYSSSLYVYANCKDYETGITFSVCPYGVAVIPGSDRASVTFPDWESIQFINTTKMTKGDKVNVGFRCYGITAGHDRIYVGGGYGTIKILDTNGKILKTIQQGFGVIDCMSYNDSDERLIIRCRNKLICINLDGTQVYSKDVSGATEITRDRQGNIYYSRYSTNDIQKMSSDGQNCEEMLNEEKHCIRRPYGMCFNNDFTKLVVINNNNKSVFEYNCKY